MSGKTTNQLIRDLSRRLAVFSESLKIPVHINQSDSEWVFLPNAAPKFANLRIPASLPSSVTKLTFRLRDDANDAEGYKLFAQGVEREILIPESGIIIEPNELIGLSSYLNEKAWQVQIRLDDVVLQDTEFYLDTA